MFPGSDFDVEDPDPEFVAPSQSPVIRQEPSFEPTNRNKDLLPETARAKALGDFEPGAELTTVRLSRHDQQPDQLATEISGRTLRAAPDRTRVYHEFMELDQAGMAVMGYDESREHNIVAIKKLKSPGNRRQPKLRPFTSDQVVAIVDILNDKDSMTVIYEPMDVTLRQVTSIVPGQLKDFQIAAVCKEVGFSRCCTPRINAVQIVQGLEFIHSGLSLYHGSLNCGNILLSLAGKIKIGNQG